MAERKVIVTGRAWVINGPSGSLIDDIDTDMIYHNAHLAITDVSQMGRHAFGNLDGWRDFPSKVKTGDIIIAGDNFGCGSSRQHAVDCFAALGVAAVIVRSVGAIYKRNAINCGFPLVVAPSISSKVVTDGEIVRVNLENGTITIPVRGVEIAGCPFSRVQMDIYKAGSLFDVRPGN